MPRAKPGRPPIDSGWLPDDDIDMWYVYRKEFAKGLDGITTGDETYLFKHGDIYHVIGELLDTLRDIRRDRHHTFHEKSLEWQTLQIRPYCYTVWGRLMDNLDEYRIYYIVTMDPESADIAIYSCWPCVANQFYSVYRWRAELPGKHGDIRKYRKTKQNSRGHYHIPPCWPTWENTGLVARGTKQSTFRRADVSR